MRSRRRFTFATVLLVAYVAAYLAIRSKSSPEGKPGFGTMRSDYIAFGASNEDIATIIGAALDSDAAAAAAAAKIERRMKVLGLAFYPLRRLDRAITGKRVVSRLDER